MKAFILLAIGVSWASAALAEEAIVTVEQNLTGVRCGEIRQPGFFVPPQASRRSAPAPFAVEKTRADQASGRGVRASLIEPPNLPEPRPRGSTDEDTASEAPSRLPDQVHRVFTLGATVHADGISAFNLWIGGERFTGWSNSDFGLIPHFHQFEIGNTEYAFFGLVSRIDSTSAEMPAIDDLPGRPQLPEDPPAFIVHGDGENRQEAETVVRALHEILIAHRNELETARDARDRYARDARQWRDANPPVPRDLDISIWRK